MKLRVSLQQADGSLRSFYQIAHGESLDINLAWENADGSSRGMGRAAVRLKVVDPDNPTVFIYDQPLSDPAVAHIPGSITQTWSGIYHLQVWEYRDTGISTGSFVLGVDTTLPLAPGASVGIITIPVQNALSLMAMGYSTIELYQSLDNGGTWTEITASSATRALVSSLPGRTLFPIGGLRLVLTVDGSSPVPVWFSGVIPLWSAAQVAARINQVLPGVATANGTVVELRSLEAGRRSSIQVDPSTSAIALGFPTTVVHGCDERLWLADDQLVYSFMDPWASVGARYRWRFSAVGQPPFSPFSNSVQPSTAPFLDPNRIAIGTASFLDLNGSPLRQKVIVAGTLGQVSGAVIGAGGAAVYEADGQGFVQIPFVRGSQVTVAIESTNFVRTITVPDATSFDLYALLRQAVDPTAVQTTPPLLNRRSLE